MYLEFKGIFRAYKDSCSAKIQFLSHINSKDFKAMALPSKQQGELLRFPVSSESMGEESSCASIRLPCPQVKAGG